MTDHVKSWLSDVRGAEYGFFRAVVQALESFNDGDGNSLGKLLTITHGKTAKRLKTIEKDRMQFATPLKTILDHALQGVTYKYYKDADFGVVFKKSENGGVDTTRIEALRVLKNASIRDKAFKSAFPKITKEAPEKSEEDRLAQLHKYMAKFAAENDLSIEVVKMMASSAA